ncbi:MAG: CPBP family intramembrane metalloprotease [Phycisphaerales bacterium]|nr:CPBP family intramembrane metalloprotease [Phycisphaerales bacterium]
MTDGALWEMRMAPETTRSRLEPPIPPVSRTPAGRLSAVLEVIAAFALMHVAFRAFRRHTPLGRLETLHNLNFSPAVVMLLVSVALIAWRRRSLKTCAITAAPLHRNVNAGWFAIGIFTLVAAVAMALGLRKDPTWTSTLNALIVACLNLVFALLLAFTLTRAAPRLDRGHGWIGAVLFLLLLTSPIVIAALQSQPVGKMALALLSFVGFAAIGEEVFFRGYAQSRLNEAFGVGWRLFGISFGPGLVIAAILFGVIHGLNDYDYFQAGGRFNWRWGLTSGTTIAYGLLREKTQSVVAPMMLHAFVNFAARLTQS